MGFVIPGSCDGAFPFGSDVVALVDARHPGPVRFAAHAQTALVLEADRVSFAKIPEGAVRPVRSNYGYPLGAIDRTRNLNHQHRKVSERARRSAGVQYSGHCSCSGRSFSRKQKQNLRRCNSQ